MVGKTVLVMEVCNGYIIQREDKSRLYNPHDTIVLSSDAKTNAINIGTFVLGLLEPHDSEVTK